MREFFFGYCPTPPQISNGPPLIHLTTMILLIKIPPFDSALEFVLITDVKLLLNNSILAIYGICL